MSWKNSLILLLSFLCNISAFSQEVRPFPMEEKSLLWKVTNPNKKGELFLFGTMHLIEREYFYFPKKLQKLVENSDLIVMELAGMPNPMDMLKYVRLEEGTLFDYFSPEQSDSILNWAQSQLHLDSASFCMAFGKMKPFVVAQLGMELEFSGKTESYEMTIDALAKENGIPMQGLETIEEQMGFFDALSPKDQSEMVMESIRNASEISLIDMEKRYQAQDLDGLYSLIVESGDSWASMEDQLVKARNYNWLNQIPGFFLDKKVFIAVGAGHLGGPEGLIRLLEEQGYILTPIQL